jgi:hypothetical protein
MIPPTGLDDEISEIDVRYGIDDCRKRLRNQRAILRSLHNPPTVASNGKCNTKDGIVESYAELLANVSINQSSLSRLVECLLEPVDESRLDEAEATNREEAVLT